MVKYEAKKEISTTFCFSSSVLVGKERWRCEISGIRLGHRQAQAVDIIVAPLHMFNRKQRFAVHGDGDDDGVPNLRDKDISLVLHLHLRGCEDLRVY